MVQAGDHRAPLVATKPFELEILGMESEQLLPQRQKVSFLREVFQKFPNTSVKSTLASFILEEHFA